MFSGYPHFISSSQEYKQLFTYFNDKNFIEKDLQFATLLDRQKAAIARWVLDKLIKGKSWNHPLLPAVLIAANQMNALIENECDSTSSRLVGDQVAAFMAGFDAQLYERLNNKFKEAGKLDDFPAELPVIRSSMLLQSDLNKLLIALYVKMNKIRALFADRHNELKEIRSTGQPLSTSGIFEL